MLSRLQKQIILNRKPIHTIKINYKTEVPHKKLNSFHHFKQIKCLKTKFIILMFIIIILWSTLKFYHKKLFGKNHTIHIIKILITTEIKLIYRFMRFNNRRIMILVRIHLKFKWTSNLFLKIKYKNKFLLTPITCLKNSQVKLIRKTKKFQILYKANSKGLCQF